MRCILIDPMLRTITEEVLPVDKHNGSTLKAMYDILDVRLVERIGLQNYDLWFDEEGLFNDDYSFFRYIDKDTGNVWELAGRCVLLSVDYEEGETIALDDSITLEGVKSCVKFI